MTGHGPIDCDACGRPLGTGTLLDCRPDVPERARELGIPRWRWEQFARRYRCPICAYYPTLEDELEELTR